MDNLESQIQQFWENETTPEQRREILRQLEGSGMEWKEFLQQYYNKVLAGEAASDLSAEQKSRVWQRLQDQHLSNADSGMNAIGGHTEAKKIGFAGHAAWLPRRAAWLPWMAAACVITIISLSIAHWGKPPSSPSPIASQPVVSNRIIKKNTGSQEQNLILPDNSEVQLAPGSSITYPESFEASARNIQLEGRALFEVAKDSIRPFTVTAHGFATTALGTRFIVDATRPLVSIRLLKGKIVVNATAGNDIALQKVYLSPGQELRINTATKHFDRVAYNSNINNKQSHGKNVTNDNVNALSFERTSLESVFQRLSEYYKTPILYDKAEVQGLSFTGEFKPSDELELTLKVICNMNQLTFTKESDHIVIRKQ